MASVDGKGEQDDIWPGYVDALTTMTMVMTLIMMILGIVVFSLSQDITRSSIARIALAAGIDASASRRTADITDAIIDRLRSTPDPAAAVAERGPSEPAGSPPAPPPAPMVMASVPGAGLGPGEPSEITAALRTTHFMRPPPPASPSPQAASPAPVPSQPLAWVTPPPAATAAAAPATPATPAAPAEAAAAPTPMPSPGQELVVESRREADLARPLKGAAVRPGLAIMHVRFRDRATQLDEDAASKVRAAFAPDTPFRRAGQLELVGAADPAAGAVSDARRTAYYRILALRKELVGLGIDSNRLILRIEEQTVAENRNSVRLTAYP